MKTYVSMHYGHNDEPEPEVKLRAGIGYVVIDFDGIELFVRNTDQAADIADQIYLGISELQALELNEMEASQS